MLHPLCHSAVDVVPVDLFVCLYSNFSITHDFIVPLIPNTPKSIECTVQAPSSTSPLVLHVPIRWTPQRLSPLLAPFGLWIRGTLHAPVTLVHRLHSLPLTITNAHSFVPIPSVSLPDRFANLLSSIPHLTLLCCFRYPPYRARLRRSFYSFPPVSDPWSDGFGAASPIRFLGSNFLVFCERQTNTGCVRVRDGSRYLDALGTVVNNKLGFVKPAGVALVHSLWYV